MHAFIHTYMSYIYTHNIMYRHAYPLTYMHAFAHAYMYAGNTSHIRIYTGFTQELNTGN